MSVRLSVRDAQRSLAALDAAHARAVARLDRVLTRRAQVQTEHEQLVSAAQAEVDRTVAEMAAAIGPGLMWNGLSRALNDVRDPSFWRAVPRVRRLDR
jgi:hypothetical protein